MALSCVRSISNCSLAHCVGTDKAVSLGRDWQQKTINVQIKEECYLLMVFKSLANLPLTPAEMEAELRCLSFYGQIFPCSSEIKIFWRRKAVTVKAENGCETSNCIGRSEWDPYVKA